MTSRPLPHFPRSVILLLLASAGFLLATLPFLALTLGLRSDFLAFYTSGYLLLRGEAARLYDVALFQMLQEGWVGPYRGTRYVYLPFFSLLYVPFAAQPLLLGRLLWLVVSLVGLACAVRLSHPWSGLSMGERLLSLLAFPALYPALLVGQNSPLTLLLFISVAGLLWRGKERPLMGVLAGFLLYKPQFLLGLLLLWGWQRRWRVLLAFGGSALLILAGSLLVSVPATLDYLFLGRTLFAFTTSLGANASPYAEFQSHLPADLALVAWAGLALAVLLLLLRAWATAGAATPYTHAMLWFVPFFVTPYIANYDLLLLALPLSFLAPVLRRDRLMQGGVVGLWIAPLVNVLAGEVILLTVWGSLYLYLLCFWRSQRNAQQ